MSRRIRGIVVEIGGDTTKLGDALRGVTNSSKDLQRELRGIETLLRYDPKNVNLLKQRQDVLTESVENTRKKLDTLRDAQAQVQAQFDRGEITVEQYRDFQREIEYTERQLKDYEKQLAEVSKEHRNFFDSADQASKKLKDVGDKMVDVGKDMSLKVTAPITAIGAASVKAATDFQSAFYGVRKTVDATEEEFAELEAGIISMSEEIPASAVEIAGVAEAAGQLGIEKENILEFTRTIIDLGEATDLTLEQASSEFARFANIVQMPQDSFDRLGSSVVALGNNFATTESEVVSLGMRLAAQGAQIGLTEAEIMALSATMSSLGLSAEAGGTAMSTVMKKIQVAVDEGGDSLKGFADVAGISAEQFATMFEERPIEAIDAFIKGLDRTAQEGGNLTTTLGELGISGIRETDTLLRMAGASDLLSDAVALSTQAWDENTALTEEAELRYETFQSKLDVVKNQLVNLGITIGNIIMPIISKLLEHISSAIQWFSGLDESIQTVILVIAGIVAAIGPLLIIGGKIALGISNILDLFVKLKPVFAAVKLAIAGMSAPLILVVAKIAAVIAIVIAVIQIIKNWGAITDWLKEKWAAFTEWFGAMWDSFSEAWKAGIEIITTWVSEKFEAFVEWVKNIFTSIGEWLSGFFTGIKDFVVNVVKLLVDGVVMYFTTLYNGWKNILTTLFNFIKNIFTTIKTTVTNLVKGVVNGAVNAFNGIIGRVRDIFNSVVRSIRSILNIDLGSIGRNIINGLANGIKNAVGAVTDAVKNIGSKITGGFKKFFGIKSPSTLMRDVIGKMIPQGIAVGVEADTDEALDAVDEMNKAVLQASQPDMVNMMNRNPLTSQNSHLERLTSAVGADNGVSGKLDRLIDVFDTYLAKLSDPQYQIVMENGVVVGELRNDIDNALGRNSEMKGRGRP